MAYKDPQQRREYNRQYKARRRAEYFDGKSCADCGSTERLELDHIDRSTKVDHRIWNWAKERREAELAKCQVLCYTCHKAKTRSEFLSTEHGTDAMSRRGCKCTLCKAYVRDMRAALRLRHKEATGSCGSGNLQVLET